MVSVPIDSLLAVCNPLEDPPWGECGPDEPFGTGLIQECLDRDDLESEESTSNALETMQSKEEQGALWHARRIAYFVRHGWDDPINVDVGVPGYCAPEWPVTDGNHRLAAAAFRGDTHIQAEMQGSVDLIRSFAGGAYDDRIRVSDSGDTVWVTGDDGSTVGRFSKRFGMDVHRTASEQMQGEGQCLECTHEPAGPQEWQRFCDLMKTVYGVDVAPGTLEFEVPAAGHHRQRA